MPRSTEYCSPCSRRASTEMARNRPSRKPKLTNACAGPRRSRENGVSTYQTVSTVPRSYASRRHAGVASAPVLQRKSRTLWITTVSPRSSTSGRSLCSGIQSRASEGRMDDQPMATASTASPSRPAAPLRSVARLIFMLSGTSVEWSGPGRRATASLRPSARQLFLLQHRLRLLLGQCLLRRVAEPEVLIRQSSQTEHAIDRVMHLRVHLLHVVDRRRRSPLCIDGRAIQPTDERDEVVRLLAQRTVVAVVREQRLRDAPDPGLDEHEAECDDQHPVVHALDVDHCIDDEQCTCDRQGEVK